MLDLFLCLLAGCLLGVFTGLTPGVHINLISLLLLSLSPFFLTFLSPLLLAVVIISMSITHTFLDVIPSTYLGAPNEDTALSVLPNHRLLLEGNGYHAVKLATIGSLLGLFFAVLSTPLLVFLVRKFYDSFQAFIPYLLLASLVYLFYLEKKKVAALLVILFSGVLGILSLSSFRLEQPLFPLLSGLFGSSTLLLSLKDVHAIPLQFTHLPLVLDFKKTLKSVFASLGASSFVGFLPGVSSAQAAIIASSVLKDYEEKYYLLMLGAINTIVMVIGFVAYYTIDKARNGSVVVIMKLLGDLSFSHFMVFLSVILLSCFFASFLTLYLAKVFGVWIPKISYPLLCLSIVFFVSCLVAWFSGYLGLLFFLVATAVGMLAPLLGVARHHLMACLLVPILFFLFL